MRTGKILLIGAICVLSHVACETRREGALPVTPVPEAYAWGRGVFELDKNAVWRVEASGEDKEILTAYLEERGVSVGDSGGKVELVTKDVVEGIDSEEGYVLTISRRRARVEALSGAGLFYGTQTLLQLWAACPEGIPAVTIRDEPRFAYRGIMLDVSRHFRDKDFVEKQIDALAAYKINRLHLHLTDAAGWRVEIDRYPRLTEFAAWRPQATWKEWWNGKREYCERTDSRASGGFYTKEEMRELVDYARRHYVTIVPEIEMPSHSEEVLAAYPELSCTGEPYRHGDFCIGKEETFEFIENVLTEVMEIFPSEYIHVGGDEASKASWKTCPDCQARMKAEGLKDVDELQSYLIHRVERFLNDHGRKLMGWDEILDGGVAPNAVVMAWRGVPKGVEAVREGNPVVMNPGQYCYIDSYQDAPYSQPEAIGGYLPLEKIYGFEPVPDTLSPEEAELIIGTEANLFAEYIPTAEHMEYMLYPRAIALAEVAWSLPGNKSWESFHRRALRIVDELRKRGYNTFDLKNEIGNREEAKAPVAHLGVGKTVKYNAPAWEAYPAAGERTLTDGLRGGWNYNDGRWQAFATSEWMDVVIDLGEERPLHSIGADFMQICGPGVFLPERVVISVSADGARFTPLVKIEHKVRRDDQVTFKRYEWTGSVSARYVRMEADAAKEFGGVLFTDEIVIK